MRDGQAFTVRFPLADHVLLKMYAGLTGKTMGAVVLAAVRRYLADEARGGDLDAVMDEARATFRSMLQTLGDD